MICEDDNNNYCLMINVNSMMIYFEDVLKEVKFYCLFVLVIILVNNYGFK